MYITYHVLLSKLFPVLLLFHPTSAFPASVWDISIFRGPAPPADEGPPLSAGAIRDKSKLKYEVVGIVGAYLFWCLLTILLIFLVGKKLRRRAQTRNRISVPSNMKFIPAPIQLQRDVEPALRSPLSPRRLASLKSWTSSGKGHSHKRSDVSVSTIDEKVVELDRARNMDEMAKLYAAVMARDDEIERPKNSGPQSPRSPYSSLPRDPSTRNAIKQMPSPPLSPQYPPELQYLRNENAITQNNPITVSQQEYDDIPRSIDTSRASSHMVKASPLSFISTSGHVRTGSNGSRKAPPSRIAVRGHTISAPLVSADPQDLSTYAGNVSVSPRIYNPGPPPATPGRKQTEDVIPYEENDVSERILRLSPPKGVKSANTSQNSLPFRNLYQDSLKSAPATKTTFLDHKEHLFPPHPRTGLPQGPYSPYVPFTPVTPITPRRLVTREDRKRAKKAAITKPASEIDMVKSDDDMWGQI